MGSQHEEEMDRAGGEDISQEKADDIKPTYKSFKYVLLKICLCSAKTSLRSQNRILANGNVVGRSSRR